MMRKLIALLLGICVLSGLTGCAPSGLGTYAGTSGQMQGIPSASTQAKPDVGTPAPSKIDPSFAQMPQMYSELAEVYLSGDVAVFAFITPGMNEAFTSILTYDLQADRLLGQLELGEDVISIFPLEAGSFAVLSHTDLTIRIFDAACDQIDTHALMGLDSQIGFAGLYGDRLLLSQVRTGTVLLYDLTDDTRIPVDLTPGLYHYVGAHAGGFLIESYSDGLIAISFEGVCQTLFADATAQVTGSVYAAGIQGDHILLWPLAGGEVVKMTSLLEAERFLTADGIGLLSCSQSSADWFHYYDTNSMTVTALEAGGQVLDAALLGQCVIAVIRTDATGPLSFVYLDLALGDTQNIA